MEDEANYSEEMAELVEEEEMDDEFHDDTEDEHNFSNYRNRFSMPGNTEVIFYSWNIGPAHIISYSTEVYFWLQYGIEQIVQQYEWLIRDLEEATLPENRSKRPWIITMAHKPRFALE